MIYLTTYDQLRTMPSVKSGPSIPQTPAPRSKEGPVDNPPTSTNLAEAESALPEADNDIDGCEALLRCAIQMVHAPMRSSETPPSLLGYDTASSAGVTKPNCAQPESVAPAIATSLPEEQSTAAAAAPNVADLGPAVPFTVPFFEKSGIPVITIQPPAAKAAAAATVGSLSEVEPTTPSTTLAERPANHIVVQIHFDPIKGRYVTRDTTSGLTFLGHQDRARLCAMCDRLGWHVVESAVTDEND